MHNTSYNHTKLFFILFLSLFFLGGQPPEFGRENSFFHGYLIQKPVIRVGLGVGLQDIRIRASAGMKVYEVNSHYRQLADDVDEVYIKGRKDTLSEKFLIQVKQVREMEEAELFAQNLRTKIQQKVTVIPVQEDGAAGFFQVMVGDFMVRSDALDYIKKLNDSGIKDTWIVREEITGDDSRPLWILVENELKTLNTDTELYFVPSSRYSYLSYGLREYRGIFVLKTTSKGIVLINILNLENYLKGVVPSELSPYTYTELDAHKAQAVAARTYAIKNMNMNGDLGFDLCDTPTSQFYKGMGAEHPLSNQAVEETEGEVAVYRGKLINALYTSTCGGRTENVESIFGGNPVPYLKSTECTSESRKEWVFTSQRAIPPVTVHGRNISLKAARLISLGVLPPQTDPAFYEEEVALEEAVDWIRKALGLYGIPYENYVSKMSRLDFQTMADLFIHAFRWQDRVENLILESETEHILTGLEDVSEETKSNLAYLLQTGIFPTIEEIGDTGRVLTRGEAVICLSGILSEYGELAHNGFFKEVAGQNILRVEEEGQSRELFLSDHAFLVKDNAGISNSVERLRLIGGENLSWIENDGHIHLLEVHFSVSSNVLDRSSYFNSWRVRRTRRELERRIKRYYPIGELRDVIPLKRGKSRRVIELRIQGMDREVVVKGFRIRTVLGLRETLFVINREYDAEGKISRFIFSGRGWGHGVGLCQVGAFGMARNGADYLRILKKYYRGIRIEKRY